MAYLRSGLLTALISIAASSSLEAHAVYLNPNGSGQALIYPYFSTQSKDGSPFNTYVSLVNRSSDAKVLRVRFREGRAGREVAVFNLYLGSRDTWTAALVPTSQGTRLITVDQSCVNSPFAGVAGGPLSYDFDASSFSGSHSDGLGTDATRLREGYVEVLEMATLTGASAANVAMDTSTNPPRPHNCAAVQGDAVSLETAAPSGGLSGTLTVINVANGLDFTVNADALEELASRAYYRDVGDSYPDFNAAEVDPVATFQANGKSYRTTWGTGVQAVSAALTHASLGGEVILDTITASATDWVVTFPMQRFSALAHPPTSYPAGAGQGQPVSIEFSPRDGTSVVLLDECGMLCPGNAYPVSPLLPWTATVLSFRTNSSSASVEPTSSSTALASANAVRVTLPTSAQNGTGSVVFGPALNPSGVPFTGSSIRHSDGVVSSEGAVLGGLPAAGFMARTLQNGFLQCGSALCQGNYGGAYPLISQSAIKDP
jgi:hypothetical protein